MSDQFLPPDEPPERDAQLAFHPQYRSRRSRIRSNAVKSEAIADAIEIVTADDLYKPATRKYLSITSLFAAGGPADIVTVADELERSGFLRD
ncbi:MAG: hypothetical protein Ct9H90mP5_09690 [Acidimicrobiaceae bacterium]|nr:MAG: hypothetical protein Ct9H90mP5_09690 [Acidimicrobiaceae bacterium]